MRARQRRQARHLAVAVVIGYAALSLMLLAGAGGRLDSFVRFGADTPTFRVAQEKIGPDVVPVSGEGFDGQYSWLQAHDPLLLVDPGLHDRGIDEPAYRSPRFLYPLVASPGLLLGESGLMVSLVVVNLIVVGLGTYLTSLLSVDLGGRPIGGLVFALAPGMITAAMQDVGDPLALALFVGSLLCLVRDRFPAACLLAVASVATKEFFLVAVVSTAVFSAGWTLRRRLIFGGSSAALFLAVSGYVRLRLERTEYARAWEVVPFRGFVDAFRLDWQPNGRWAEAALSIACVALAVYAVIRWSRDRHNVVLASTVLVAVTTPALAGVVVRYPINLSRALAVVVFGVVLDVVVQRARRDGAPVTAAAVT